MSPETAMLALANQDSRRVSNFIHLSFVQLG